MTEIPIVVSTNEITVGGVVDQIELQLGLGEKGDRGSRIFSGDVSPLTLPANSPFFSGYTEFKPGDVYVERSATNIAMWEWKSQPGGYTWVKTADIAVSGGGGMTSLDPDLTAIAAVSGTGYLRRTGVDTWTLDTPATATWGGITGTLSSQTDLQTALNAKAPLSNPIFLGTDASDYAVKIRNNASYNSALFVQRPVGANSAQLLLGDTADKIEAYIGVNNSGLGVNLKLDGSTNTSGISFYSGNTPGASVGTTDIGIRAKLIEMQATTVQFNGLADFNGGVSLVGSSTDNAIVRFDGTGGAVQNSGVTIDDNGWITGGRLHINSAGGGESSIFLQSGGVNRWKVYKDSTTEGGSNGGSHLVIEKQSDAGGGNGAVVTLFRDSGTVRLHSVGSTAGLEFGASGPRMMMGTGTPSGVSAPIGSTWRQTDANSTYGNLTGLLWNKVGSGTTLGTDWLVDFEGRIPHIRARGLAFVTSTGWNKLTFGTATEASRMVSHSSGTFTMSAPGLYQVNLQVTQTAGTTGTRIVTSNGDYVYAYYWMFDDATNTPQRTVSGSRIYPVSTTLEMWCYTQVSITVDCMVQIAYLGNL